MNIQDAIIKAEFAEKVDGIKRYVARTKFFEGNIPFMKLEPTDSVQGFIMHSFDNQKFYARWQPNRADLVADDWIITS